ncbi:MAG TPA: hypothetical protein VN673_04020 [Clostridia bacterium]|nr:hypothetical protein [Clostridia bacterium]
MDLSKLHSLTNRYQDVRLISLHGWKESDAIDPRDNGGPYVVVQEAYDPADFKMRPDEFVLSKSGHWMAMGYFFRLPQETRRDEFVFGTAAEVVRALEQLPPVASVVYSQAALEELREGELDELNAAIIHGKETPFRPDSE